MQSEDVNSGHPDSWQRFDYLEPIREKAKRKRDCGWEWDAPNCEWVTGCGHEFSSSHGDAPCTIYEYCPFCGGRIVEESSE